MCKLFTLCHQNPLLRKKDAELNNGHTGLIVHTPKAILLNRCVCGKYAVFSVLYEDMASHDLATAVYELVEHVPAGKVTTYGEVAHALGLKTPRQVGWILHRNPSHRKTPCHRVVFSDGRLSGQFAFGGPDAQRHWLESEGVIFKGDHVDMKQCRWEGV